METSNLTLPQGAEMGKYRFSFFFHHRQGGDGSLKSTDTEASEELLQRTAKAADSDIWTQQGFLL